VEVTSLDLYDSQRAHIIPYFSSASSVVASVPDAFSTSTLDLPLIGTATFTSVTAGAGDLPVEYALSQNYPNPFNPATRIDYAVPAGRSPGNARVKLAVYDLLGREVARLVDDVQAAGEYTVTFDASGCASGTYIYRISIDGWSTARTMLLLR
jgi:hypothetical protein